MSTDLPRTTLVTGTSRGIGLFLATHLLKAGHRVIGCARTSSAIQHKSYTHFECDVTEETQVASMFTQVRRQFGTIDHLINNAGVASMNHSLFTPGRTAQEILAVNVLGSFILAREGARLMQRKKYGRIVNFSTIAVPLRLEGEAVYAASKAAVLMLTKILAKELAPWNITVNAVGPTPVETALIRSVPADKIKALIGHQAIKRMGTFSDIMNVIDFYLRPESNFVTGQNLFLGGVS